MPPHRLIVLVTSPRLPAGVLSRAGWAALAAGRVFAQVGEGARALRGAGVEVTELEPVPDEERAADLLERVGSEGCVIWVARPGGETALGAALAARGDELDGVVLEVVYGSWDPPGARLLDAVAVMDRLRSPGGCPWDAEQTHTSLMPYLLEEAYEAYGALEEGDPDALRDELGDVLLQVLFHARVAQEAEDGFGVDDVARGLVDKLVRRHPHVFADGTARDAAEVDVAEVDVADADVEWDAIKATERAAAGRTSVTDGVPLSQPALSLAAKLQRRAEGLGLSGTAPPPVEVGDDADQAVIGAALFAVVGRARRAGVDPEAALRTVAREFRDRIRVAESAGVDGSAEPA